MIKNENNISSKNPFEGKKVLFIKDNNYNENADGVRGYLKENGISNYKPTLYEIYIKRIIDIFLSIIGIIILSPIFIFFIILIYIDDPGPVIFSQKRIGKNKKYFNLHKFRSMKLNTPHDVPTHMLNNTNNYITKIGRFIRKNSIDELPQLFDILIGNMSIVGPRPALWNQDLLIAERDKYNANDIKPGLTGLAQISGRDTLSIEDKAKLDGEYVNKISFLFDIYCIIKTVINVIKHKDIVEGSKKNTNK